MRFFYLFSLVFLLGCSDNTMTKVYEQNLPKNEIPCLNLVIFPPNEAVEKSFEKLYDFDEACRFKLLVEVKGGITCNSNENIQKKAMGSFPSSYINMQLSQNSQKIYSYYRDLKDEVGDEEIEDTFFRMRDEINLK